MRASRRKLELKRSAAGARARFLAVAALVADATGVAMGDIIRIETYGRPRRRRSDKTGFARHAAVYLTVTALGVGQGALARATGRGRNRIYRILRDMEDARDRPDVDRFLAGIEACLEAQP